MTKPSTGSSNTPVRAPSSTTTRSVAGPRSRRTPVPRRLASNSFASVGLKSNWHEGRVDYAKFAPEAGTAVLVTRDGRAGGGPKGRGDGNLAGLGVKHDVSFVEEL